MKDELTQRRIEKVMGNSPDDPNDVLPKMLVTPDQQAVGIDWSQANLTDRQRTELVVEHGRQIDMSEDKLSTPEKRAKVSNLIVVNEVFDTLRDRLKDPEVTHEIRQWAITVGVGAASVVAIYLAAKGFINYTP